MAVMCVHSELMCLRQRPVRKSSPSINHLINQIMEDTPAPTTKGFLINIFISLSLCRSQLKLEDQNQFTKGDTQLSGFH